MSNFFLAMMLLVLAVAGVVIRKTYDQVPLKELKRQAGKHDPVASRLYSAAAYGSSLRGLLWLFIGLTSAGGFILLAIEAPAWLSFCIVALTLYIAFALLPATRVSPFGRQLTYQVTPAILWILNYLHPLLNRSVGSAQRKFARLPHTGLFERDDLLELIAKQKDQPDSRFTPEELDIASRALQFSDHKVRDILIPRHDIKTVFANDTIGPILIDEMHQSGGGYVLVKETKKGPFTGWLEFKQLNITTTGRVHDVMHQTVYYLHENDSLSEALHAFFVTNHSLFVVVNSAEDYLGVMTVEKLLKQLLGHVPGDEFDQYADPAAVAARHTKQTETADNDETPVKTDEIVIE